MNGAIAEPCVSTIRLPKIIIMMRVGISQYFLRTRRNIQNSCRSDNMRTSELLFHRLGRRPRRLAGNPVAFCRRMTPQAQWVLASRAHEQADECHGDVEENHQYDWADDLGKQQTE